MQSPSKAKSPKEKSRGAAQAGRDRGDSASQKSSGTQFLRRNIYTGAHERVTKPLPTPQQDDDSSEPIRGSLDKQSIELLDCANEDSGAAIAKLAFLLTDECGRSQKKRVHDLLWTYIEATTTGFCIRDLLHVVPVIDYLVESKAEKPGALEALLNNAAAPVSLLASSDVDRYSSHLTQFYNFLGYLLVRLEEDAHFDLAFAAACSQLERRGARPDAAPLRARRSAAVGTTLVASAARMLSLACERKFCKYLRLALLLATISADTCIHLIRENILENIMYRFNPYFPDHELPDYDINPRHPHDVSVKLGESGVHVMSVLSLLVILLNNFMEHLATNPESKSEFKCPDSNALRCWSWAFRYECRAREHRHERTTMLSVTMGLLRCFGDRLVTLSVDMMPDVLSLAVHSEVPARGGWLGGVHFDTGRADVRFKKLLIHASAQFISTFPRNIALVEERHWMVGLMYLVDPCLYQLRFRWDEPLFAELRSAALQAMVVVLPLCPSHLAKECGLIRRSLWYIEWYTVRPYETSLLYWNLRLVQAMSGARGSAGRQAALDDLADSHALIVIINLCHTIVEAREPPLERHQVILVQCLRLMTSAAEYEREVQCRVYSHIEWPVSVNTAAKAMLDVLLVALNRNFIVTPMWTIALFNFIWESIMWKEQYRTWFISNNGIYKILDVISMSGESVQCIGLALVCEAARAGAAVAQLVSWRARPGAAERAGAVVGRGGTLAQLLAGIARDECARVGVRLHQETGVIRDLEFPLMGNVERRELEASRMADPTTAGSPRCLFCPAASGLAGSRLSKVYALLQMLSDDLDHKVSVADEAYKMYKDVSLSVEDEVMLVLCSHYLVCKLGEVWGEVDALIGAGTGDLVAEDSRLLDEFILLFRGWAREIKYQQEQIYEKQRKKEGEEEASLYAFLARCRLTTALDALHELRRCARATDAAYLTHARLNDAVLAHYRRSSAPGGDVLRTYRAPIDIANVIGQNVRVLSIPRKDPREDTRRSTGPGGSCSPLPR